MSSPINKRGSAGTVEREELKKRIVGLGSTPPPASTSKSSSFDSFFASIFSLPKEDPTPKRTSMTRPRFLPPKSLEEEERHLREYEEMMEQYQKKVADEARKKELRRREMLLKEEKILENTRKWEEEILPNWDEKRNLVSTRDLWWQGLPPRLREKIWVKASGNKLQVTPELFLRLAKEGEEIRIALEKEEAALISPQSRSASHIQSEKLTECNTGLAPDNLTVENGSDPEDSVLRMLQNEEAEALRVAGKENMDDQISEPHNKFDLEDHVPVVQGQEEQPETVVEDDNLRDTGEQQQDKECTIPEEDNAPRIDKETKPPQDGTEPCGSLTLVPQSKDAMRLESISLLGNKKSVNQIVVDLPRTFPALSFFQPDGPYYPGLRQVLEAYSVLRSEVGYVQGMSYIAAALLLNLEPFDAFQCMCNLLSSKLLTSFYKMSTPLMERVFRAFDLMLAKYVPRVQAHFRSKGVFHALYLIDWILTVFTKSFPIDVATRILDIYFFEGEYFIFRAALGVLKYLEPDLIKAEFDGILRILQRLSTYNFEIDALFETIRSIPLTADETRALLIQAKSRNKSEVFGDDS